MAQWVKDPVLSLLWLRLLWWHTGLVPGQGTSTCFFFFFSVGQKKNFKTFFSNYYIINNVHSLRDIQIEICASWEDATTQVRVQWSACMMDYV